MIDRFGHTLRTGWPEHHLVWIRAALTLPTRQERIWAYEDIAGLTGRSFKAVLLKAASVEDERINASRRAAVERRRAEIKRKWLEANTPA